ncbi:energy transducer TonB [Pseudoduganella sp. S-14]|jgi:periplasmic protein TonB|uniref:energy transducer TonB n=1 Tax=Pseudoduganella sp. S-14 TaxID=3404065 RepID=UPI003CEE74AD
MNFDTSRKNYSGLAFVAALHLVAAGIALKHSTILITRSAPTVIVDVPPLEHQDPEPQRSKEFEVREKAAPVIAPPPPDGIKIEVLEHAITTSPPETAHGHSEPGGGGGGTGGGSVEAVRHEPVNVAAVIDAANCAKPTYPAGALRNGDEGTVTLAFLIGKDGHVASAKVERTSGHRDLDRAALQGLSLCAFKPGTVDGVAQESWARMQYAWRLDE